MKDNSESLGQKLRELRKDAGKTLREVELLSGVSNAYLSQLETGKIVKPSVKVLIKLCDVYGCSLNDFSHKSRLDLLEERISMIEKELIKQNK